MPEVVVRPPDRAAGGPVAFACRFFSTTGAARVTPVGELDIAAVPAFDRVLQRAAAVAETIVLDLRSVEFIDAGATAFLLAAHRRISHGGGRLVVVRGPAEVGWILALAGVDRYLELVDQPPLTLASHRGARPASPAGPTPGSRCS
jgi:anti-anti-sigma factor